jgi:hypothetical protein
MNWITHRVPRREETGEEEQVILPCGARSVTFEHYETVTLGQPWCSPYAKESPAAPPEPEPRKIVQIAVSNESDRPTAIYAVCNDGTIWVDYPVLPDHFWRRLPSIPQP